jgi:MarR family 2-MHQ and catechol resistance regulon transcriptional repressor
MPRQPALSSAQTRALGAYVALMRATEAVTARVHRPLKNHALTLGQFAVLEALHHCGPLRTSEIAKKDLRSCGNMTTVLDNLERDGLVWRERRVEDRRCVHVYLTAEGQRLIDAVFPAHAVRLAEEFAPLTAAEQAELKRLCQKLGGVAE